MWNTRLLCERISTAPPCIESRCCIQLGALVSGFCGVSCARSLCQDLHIRILGNHLVQDLCLRIRASGSFWAFCITCARSLCRKLCMRMLWNHFETWYKIPVPGSVHQDLLEPLAQPLSQIMSGSLHQDPPTARVSCQCKIFPIKKSCTCIWILYHHFSKTCLRISASGSWKPNTTCARPRVRDLCIRISASRSCRTSCARSLCTDLLCKTGSSRNTRTTCARSRYRDVFCKLDPVNQLFKISLSKIILQDHLSNSLSQDLLCKISVRISASGFFVSRSLVQDVRVRNSASESCTGPLDATCGRSPSFRITKAQLVLDLRRGLHLAIGKRNFTSIIRAMDTHTLPRVLHLKI